MNTRPWLDSLLRPLLVAAMVGCVVLSLVGFVRLLLPDWDGSYLVVFCALTTFEAFYSYRLIRDSRMMRLSGAWKYRAMELVLLFLLLQMAGNIGTGRANPLAGIPRLDMGMMAASILVLISWVAATFTARDLDQVGEEPERHADYVLPAQRLMKRFFAGGVVLLAAAGLTRVGIGELLNDDRASVPGLVLNVLIYFVLGMVMLGQIRYSALHSRWQAQGLHIAEGLAGRWVRYSLMFLGLVAFIAFLLPTSYTVGLLDVGRFILGLVIWFFLLIGALIVIPLGWLMSLLGRGMSGSGDSPPFRMPPLQPPPPAGGSDGGDWLGLFRSLLFWIVALAIILYMVRSYMRQHPGALRALAGFGPLRTLARWWVALWRRLGGYVDTAGERIRRRIPQRRPRRAPGNRLPRFLRPGDMPPREQVLYYYLDTLRRAGRHGFARGQAQTPDEYNTALSPSLPEAQQEMGRLTQAFIVARYSPHNVPPDHAGTARSDSEQVDAALDALERRSDDETDRQ